MNQTAKCLLILCLVVLTGLFSGCGSSTANAGENSAPDYSKSQYWLSLPSTTGKSVDVFYVYPTEYNKIEKTDPMICEVDNPSMIKGAKPGISKAGYRF